MTQTNKYRAYFSVSGDFDPAEITALLGMAPSDSWKKGDVSPKTRLERKCGRWSLYSRLTGASSLEEQIADVIQRLEPHVEAISDLGTKFETVMQLVGYFHSYYPGFALDQETIVKLARLRLGIDCDFYYLYSDEREDS